MSCSARLPIYVVFSQMFFAEHAMIVAYSMYILGIVVALATALVLKLIDKKESKNNLLIELPEYKAPNAYSIAIYVWEKVKDYITRAGTIIFVAKGDTVEIDEGVNTLTSPKSGEVKEMGSVRVSSTIDYVVHDLELFGEEYKKAKSNTDSFRATYATTVQQQYLDPLVAQEILKEGASYEPDPDYYGENATKKAKANEAFFVGDITPNESPEKIYQKLGTVF